MTKFHSFHIPVMGIGFTADAALTAAPYGVDTVISLVDDMLIERLRQMHCQLNDISFKPISRKTEDFRAKRITSYLNLIHKLLDDKYHEMKNSALDKSRELKEYFSSLPDSASVKQEFFELVKRNLPIEESKRWLKENLQFGSVDVNIMTKVDKPQYKNGEQLPAQNNDAHTALKGFAESNLTSSIVFSAGMNPSLFSYAEQFDCFYPDVDGNFGKKIILKVSDYRSALIQGKLLAKKGLWVSEFRFESGLNCGGHAFAAEGLLMGPVLEEFKKNRSMLRDELLELFYQGLESKNKTKPARDPDFKLTGQGGVGTAEEHEFLLSHYELDSVGWGTPFMLVPEISNVDDESIELLKNAREKDLYLSNISPLGIPFNSVRGNTKDLEKEQLIRAGKPGSPCQKKYVALNFEFTKEGICPASRQFQKAKIEELKEQDLSAEEYRKAFNKITEKSCICVGLGTSILKRNGLSLEKEGQGVSLCPGPNLAYFSRRMSFKNMCDHIYGRDNMIERDDRPHVFINELNIFINFLKEKIAELEGSADKFQMKYLRRFHSNLTKGITYYQQLFSSAHNAFKDRMDEIRKQLDGAVTELSFVGEDIARLKPST